MAPVTEGIDLYVHEGRLLLDCEGANNAADTRCRVRSWSVRFPPCPAGGSAAFRSVMEQCAMTSAYLPTS